VIVPSQLLGKEHYAARTIRPKIHQQLPKFLKTLDDVRVKIPWTKVDGLDSLDPEMRLLDELPTDRSVGPVNSFTGGSKAARLILNSFVKHRLNGYANNRNHPEVDGTSRLSPYLHFGHIGPHAVALAVKQADAPAEDQNAFLEELIVRRELAVNFVRYNSKYDAFDASDRWADQTLRIHAKDARQFVYSEKQLRTRRRTIRFGTLLKNRWCSPAGCMDICACIGPRKFSSGAGPRRKPTTSPCA
jgi:deoxyribodipyrimidine photo-lyase